MIRWIYHNRLGAYFMLSTPFLIQLGLMATAMLIVLIIGYMRPHRADIGKSKQKWVIPPTLFRYAFWFGILASLIATMFAVQSIYELP